MNTGEYFPAAPVDDEARRHNQNLPGMGGVFNHINANLYAYAGNNPIKYTDPDGRDHGIPSNIQKILDERDPRRKEPGYCEIKPATKINKYNFEEWKTPNYDSHEIKYKVYNQEKTEEYLRAKGTSITTNDNDYFSLELTGYRVTSEFDNTTPVEASANFSFMTANLDCCIGQTCFDYGITLNAISVGGEIGTRFLKIPFTNYGFKIKFAGSLGATAGFEIKCSENDLVFDVGLILKPRIEIQWSEL